MRMFAGPNGSGKSSLKTLLRPELQGIYLNPDELEKEMRTQGRLNLISYGITATLKFYHFSVAPLFFSLHTLWQRYIKSSSLREC
jgi:hypothetical protein